MPLSSADQGSSNHVAVRSGFLPDRTIHLHPTRLCNLQCLHCYSSSGTQYKEALDPQGIVRALAVLRTEGYELISLSGGEPLAYRPLRALIEQAKDMGYRVTMITNGLLATERMDATLALLDGMAISFDGLAATHDRMRARPGTFERACQALQRLAGKGRPVAAAISLTRDALPELPELAEHLVQLGARALQIRPVAMAGRARTLNGMAPYSDADRARLYLVAMALAEELNGSAHVSCDLAPSLGLWQQRDAYAGLLGECKDKPFHQRPLSDLVNPLVITDEGVLKPIAYDFDHTYDIARIDALSSAALQDYKREGLPAFQDLVGSALASCSTRNQLVDWFDCCARMSEMRTTAAIA